MSSSAGDRLLLSIPEAAELLSIGRSSLYGLIHRQEIPTVKIGNRRLIAVTALEHWVAELTST
jgi:excisionase family DNA binding protein